MSKLLVLIVSMLLVSASCGGDDDPVDAGMTADAGDSVDAPASDGGAMLDFLEMCDPLDDQCGDGLQCFMFNMRGPHCTHSCTFDTDCEAPSPGCNNMGVCRVP